jgi:hypothetical protein
LTRATRALLSECLHCGREFVPRKHGHVFCSVECRHGGERGPFDPPPDDPEVVARLFDPSRDPDGLVTMDDWFAPAGASESVKALYLVETVGQRRRWYMGLHGISVGG